MSSVSAILGSVHRCLDCCQDIVRLWQSCGHSRLVGLLGHCARHTCRDVSDVPQVWIYLALYAVFCRDKAHNKSGHTGCVRIEMATAIMKDALKTANGASLETYKWHVSPDDVIKFNSYERWLSRVKHTPSVTALASASAAATKASSLRRLARDTMQPSPMPGKRYAVSTQPAQRIYK